VDFFRKAIAFTRRFPVLQCRKFFLGQDLNADGVADLSWFAPHQGAPAWGDANARTLCYQLDATEDGSPAEASRLFFILNGDFQSQWVTLPPLAPAHAWYRAVDTSLPAGQDFAGAGSEVRLDPADRYIANPRSTVVLLAR
jgi:isoamylase